MIYRDMEFLLSPNPTHVYQTIKYVLVIYNQYDGEFILAPKIILIL